MPLETIPGNTAENKKSPGIDGGFLRGIFWKIIISLSALSVKSRFSVLLMCPRKSE